MFSICLLQSSVDHCNILISELLIRSAICPTSRTVSKSYIMHIVLLLLELYCNAFLCTFTKDMRLKYITSFSIITEYY
jgi:hypothetical protein